MKAGPILKLNRDTSEWSARSHKRKWAVVDSMHLTYSKERIGSSFLSPGKSIRHLSLIHI